MRVWRMVGAGAAMLALATISDATAAPRIDADGGFGGDRRSSVRVGDERRQIELTRSAAWQSFRALHGDWRVLWNEATGTPHRALGRGIPLPGFAGDPASADRAVREFVAEHSELFGVAPRLETVAAQRVGDRWYVRFRQTLHGIPVRFADWEFRLGPGGRLFAFGADAARLAVDPDATPRIVGAVAREAAKAGLAFDPATDRVEGGEALSWIPWPGDRGTEYRLAWDTRVRTADPPGDWTIYVDAATGEILHRVDAIRYDVAGTVSGTIHPVYPTDALESRPFPHQYVIVGGSTAVTGASGAYSAAPGGTVPVTAAVRGLYCDVNRSDAADAAFAASATDPGTLDIAWTDANSHVAERDGYVSVNAAHDHLKTLDPGFTGLDYSMPCAVNLASTCNAYWDGNGVNFYAAGDGCPNMASMANVVFHEYGHGVNDRVYLQAGGAPMNNGALHEGMADVNAAFIQDDPVIGRGFFGPGTSIRTLDNTRRWPDDESADPHFTGTIIGGAFWDLRESVGLPLAEHLAHFARYGAADDFDDGVAMYEYFIETLVADDNDADLSNGTPHGAAIIEAFNRHGIGTAYSIAIAHVPPPDQPSGANVPIRATITDAGVIGQLDHAALAARLSINHGPWQTVPLTPTGNPGEFAGTLPLPSASVARYYLTAGDDLGGVATLPSAAPEANAFTLIVGPLVTPVVSDMETDPGWTVGAPGDAAVTGIWVREDPIGTSVAGFEVQPEDDHTPGAGVTCWVTGNGPVGGGAGANDVDGGATTLTTSVFDAIAGGIVHPVIEYYRWYTNELGSTPGTDFWRVDISNDAGGTWTPVENTSESSPWRRVVFSIEDLLTPTSQMRMRFIAEDSGLGSLVEAAVDDFRVIGFPANLTGVGTGNRDATLTLASSPNPWSAAVTVRFALPGSGPVSLGIYDLSGRRVRSLVDGPFAAGSHARAWDGRDDAGRRVPNGAYFARLRHDGHERVEKLVKVD